jgi:hypothetical protein
VFSQRANISPALSGEDRLLFASSRGPEENAVNISNKQGHLQTSRKEVNAQAPLLKD